MIIVVSDKDLSLVDDSGVLVVDSLSEVKHLVGGITALVYHSSKEDINSFSANLATLKEKGIGSLWYVRSTEEKDVLIEMAIVGSGGYYVEDEFFLDDIELVRSLVGNASSENQLMSLGGEGVLKDFTERYLSSGDSNIPQGYLKVVSSAISQMTEDYRRKSNQVIVLSEKATEVIENTSLGLQTLSDERENLSKILKELETTLEDTKVPSRGSNVMFFPRVSYRKEKDIIRVKDVGRTPYLFSFMVGMLKYCDKVLNKRPKLIVIEPIGSTLEEIYGAYNWITSSNYSDASKFVGDLVFTNFPTSAVVTKLLEDSTKDTFIVLDRTLTSKEHILNSRTTRSVHYALSGVSSIDTLKLKNLSGRFKYFTSIKERSGSEFTIPVLDYPSSPFERENIYLAQCGNMYKELFKKG